MSTLFHEPQQMKPYPSLRSDKPAYRVLDERGLFADDVLWEYGAVVYFDDEPNELMEPLNEPARERLRSFLTRLDDLGRAKAERDGKSFVGRGNIEDALNDIREDKMRVEAVGQTGVPLMGVKRKGPGKVKAVGVEEVPETGYKAKRVEAA